MFVPIIRNKRRKALFLVGAFLIVFHRSISYSVIPNEEILTKTLSKIKPEAIVSKKTATKGNSVSISEEAPVVREQKLPDQRAVRLDKIVQSITTVTKFIGGQEEHNRGSGFVVGNRFFTVNHNLTTSFPSLRVKSTSFINGMSVTKPIFADKEQDVAVFELPDKLCARYCNNDTEMAYVPDLSASRKVYWLRKFQDDFILKEARIVGNVTFGHANQPAELSCRNNSVVLVDQPFIPGSSGSPVMDAESGKIIGVIQGSVDEDSGSQGYFKPINCVIAMVEDAQRAQSIARL